jgi:hypothetical protein
LKPLGQGLPNCSRGSFQTRRGSNATTSRAQCVRNHATTGKTPTLLKSIAKWYSFFIWSCRRDVPMSCEFERQREMPPADATSRDIIVFSFLAPPKLTSQAPNLPRRARILKLPRRNFLRFGASAAALSFVKRNVQAQVYPAKPVRIIVGSWRRDRHGRAHVRPGVIGAPGSTIRHRQSAGCRQQYRGGSGRSRVPGRLHASFGFLVERHQRDAP